MENIWIGIYALGGLCVIVYALAILWEILRKRKSFADPAMDRKLAGFMAFMLLYAPAYWYGAHFSAAVIPDGTYRIEAAVTLPTSDLFTFLFPADITIRTDVDHEDSRYYAGAVEMETTKTVAHRAIMLDRVYWPTNGVAMLECWQEVRPETDEEVWGEEGAYIVNIGAITQQRLGITKADLWERMTLGTKGEPAFIMVCCAFGVTQYLVSKRQQEE